MCRLTGLGLFVWIACQMWRCQRQCQQQILYQDPSVMLGKRHSEDQGRALEIYSKYKL